MEFEHQKPITDTYRDNWERTFKQPQPRGEFETHLETRPTYHNGCPILTDESKNA